MSRVRTPSPGLGWRAEAVASGAGAPKRWARGPLRGPAEQLPVDRPAPVTVDAGGGCPGTASTAVGIPRCPPPPPVRSPEPALNGDGGLSGQSLRSRQELEHLGAPRLPAKGWACVRRPPSRGPRPSGPAPARERERRDNLREALDGAAAQGARCVRGGGISRKMAGLFGVSVRKESGIRPGRPSCHALPPDLKHGPARCFGAEQIPSSVFQFGLELPSNSWSGTRGVSTLGGACRSGAQEARRCSSPPRRASVRCVAPMQREQRICRVFRARRARTAFKCGVAAAESWARRSVPTSPFA
jgi:hypothetical protein